MSRRNSGFYLGNGSEDHNSSSASARRLAEGPTSSSLDGHTSHSQSPSLNAYRRRRSTSSDHIPASSSLSHSSPFIARGEAGRASPSLVSSRPPPSAFPFLAHPGNPDPGMRIPGQSRRVSLESLSGAYSQSQLSHDDRQSSFDRHPMGDSGRNDSPLPLPNAPFMNSSRTDSAPGSPASSSSETLPRSPSSASLYKGSAAAAMNTAYGNAYTPVASGTPVTANFTGGNGVHAPIPRSASTHSFRPFLAPPSRPSSTCWTPPSNPLMPLNSSDPATPNNGSGFGFADGSGFLVPAVSKAPLPSTRLPAPLTKEEKPWTAKRQPYTFRSYFTTLFFIFLGAAGAAVLCYFGYASVSLLDEGKLCLVLDEQFSGGGLDESVWNTEVQLGGFGNGEFQMATNDQENLFLANNQLYIHPTLTTDNLDNILDQANYTLPDCTLAQTNRTACTAIGNAALGRVINPVRSARINTKGKKSIKYGKVEVRAKLPRGDWLWPAIWMLPEPVVDNERGPLEEEGVYGKWPLSGEIDLVEARGNAPNYPGQGSNYVRSSLNYGPLPSLYRQIYGWQSVKRTSYDKDFHTYTLEWTDKFMRMYVDKRVTAMLEVDHLDDRKSKSKTRGGFWSRGKFPKTALNGSEEVVVENIWEKKGGATNAPFDQPFYLIINVAAGGTSGWFPDGKGGKPWYDGSLTAMRDFARDQETWASTWPESREDRSLRVDSVKMWEVCR